MSWLAEVMVTGEPGQWHKNGLRFATKEEAVDYATGLMWRWTAVEEMRAREVDEPVLHRLVNGEVEAI